jgi:hypothetical protein
MLEFVRQTASERELRLFAAACVRHTPAGPCRTVWALLADGRCRLAVELAKRYVDEDAGEAEVLAAWSAARAAVREASRSSSPSPGVDHARLAASEVADVGYQGGHRARGRHVPQFGRLLPGADDGQGQAGGGIGEQGDPAVVQEASSGQEGSRPRRGCPWLTLARADRRASRSLAPGWTRS